MSMTITAKPQVQNMAEWVKIFPQQVTESYTSSVTFMKQLTVVAISTITYLKNLFPHESFTTEYFGGMRLQILKKNCEDELAQFVSTAIMQAFEAFDKKYLHQLAICFYDGECVEQNLVEYHIFEYTYNSEGISMSVKSRTRSNVERSARYSFDNVKEKTIHMIRACVVLMETCREELPPAYDVSLRLYYNKAAPDGYQAPGFIRPDEERDHLQATRRHTFKLGCVETPFHRVTPRTYIKDNYLSTEPAVNSLENMTPMSLAEDDFNFSSTEKSECETSNGNRIQCPCNKVDINDTLLTCYVCHTQQHAACFGVKRSSAARLSRHCCVACSDADPARLPTDPQLVPLSAKRRECMCMLRRTLSWCGRVRSVSASLLMDKFGLAPLYATKLINILHTQHVVSREPHSDLMSPHQVNVDQLKRVMYLFFTHQDPDSQRIRVSLEPSSSSKRSECSPSERSCSAEEGQSPRGTSPMETTSSKYTHENNVDPNNVAITNVSSLAENVERIAVKDEEMGNGVGKRKRSRLSTAGIKTKRVKGNSD